MIQLTCWQVVFWLLYILFLKKETYFLLNRFYLLFGLMASVILPFFPFRYQVVVEAAVNNIGSVVLPSAHPVSALPVLPVEHTINIPYFTIIYLTGLLWFIYKLVSSMVTFAKISSAKDFTWYNNIKVIFTDRPIAPYSFFTKVILPGKRYTEDEMNSILEHEVIHIKQYHSIDLLIAEIIRAFSWLNPVCYLYVNSIKENHEFLADRGAIDSGLNQTTYRTVLANQFLNYKVVSQFNSFFNSNSLTRLKMMTKVKSLPIRKLKFLMVLPVIGLLSWAFAEPDYVVQQEIVEHDAVKESSDTFTVTGVVYDVKKGNSIPNASVTILGSNTTISTDNSGKFSLSAKKGDQLTVKHTGFSQEVFEVQVGIHYFVKLGNTNTKSKREYGDKVYQIKAKVVDENKHPLPGIKVECNTVRDHQTNSNILTIKKNDSTVTDDNGIFILEMKQGDSYTLRDFGCTGSRKIFDVGHWGSYSSKNEDGSTRWKISVYCEEVIEK